MSKTKQHEGPLNWRKATCSVGNGACVEAAARPGLVMVRDTVNRAGVQLQFSVQAWREFSVRIKGA